MTFGSLFAGIGGLDLGLERAGMECRWQVEIDPFCREVLEKHWPGVARYGDITKLTGNELEHVDLICGGFPCQDLSQAGKRAGIEGSRSGLWFEFVRIIGVARPRYVLIENVPGLLVPGAMRRVVGELARLGYVGLWVSLRASEFGAAHIRKRVFILAYRASGGLGELRQPSGGNRLAAGSDTQLADTERAERRPHDQHVRLSRGRFEEADRSGSDSGALANTECTRPDGSEREEFRTDRPPLQPARSLQCDEPVDDAHRGQREQCGRPITNERTLPGSDGRCDSLDHTEFPRLEIGNRKREQPLRQGTESIAPGLPDGELADTDGVGSLDDQQSAPRRRPGAVAECSGPILPVFAPGPSDPRWPAILRERPDLAPALANPRHAKRKTGGSGENTGAGKANSGSIAGDGSRGEPASPDEPRTEEAQPEIRGVADELPDWMDGAMSNRTKRLGRLGNAVVPQVAEWIGRRILEIEAEV